ncbi:hypothetical protein G9A89_002405 [Geosiphon pyriformis]|nr:hypothetical protein G9A89_002405 [Geosiphon pyriformis]
MSTWKTPPIQPLTESSTTPFEKTAILQFIKKINKRKQPELAPEKHLNMQTPNSLASTIITTNNWDDDRAIQAFLAEKPTDFAAFKLAFLQYFCDSNTLIRLQNQFSIIKQKDHKTIKKQPPLIHKTLPSDKSTRGTVNLAINRIFNINTKITQLSEKLTQKIEGFLARIVITTDTNNNRIISNNNNLRDLISILSKHGIPILCTLISTILILTTNLVYLATASELLSVITANGLNNIPVSKPYTTLAAIFPFDIDGLNTNSLFSETTINQNKPIMALYTDAKELQITFNEQHV